MVGQFGVWKTKMCGLVGLHPELSTHRTGPTVKTLATFPHCQKISYSKSSVFEVFLKIIFLKFCIQLGLLQLIV